MKNIKFYILSLLITCFAACTDDYNENVAPPQSYPQEGEQSIEGFTVVKDAELNVPIEIADLEEDSFIKAVKATAAPEMSAGASVSFRLQISDTESFAKYANLPVTNENNEASVMVSDLNDAIKEVFGKAPETRTFYLRAFIYVKDGTAETLISDTPVILGTVIATPVSLVHIEPAYYLVGDMNGWDASQLIKFDHSDKDVYDDPIFTAVVEVPTPCYWKVIPEANVIGGDIWAQGVLGCKTDGDTSLEGELITDNPGAIQIAEGGWVKITLNMMEYTYKVEATDGPSLLPEEMFIVGSPYNWDWSIAAQMTPIHSHEGMFWGIYYFEAGASIKFNSARSWNGNEFGAIDETPLGYGEYETGGSNAVIKDAGFYQVVIVATLEGTSVNYKFILSEPVPYIIGDTASEGWNNQLVDADKFTLSDNVFVSPTLKAGNLRMCVKIEGCDWWQTEFNIFDGVIVYRGKGDDQAPVVVTAGQNAYLNFIEGTGAIE